MQLQTKALYNLVRFSSFHNSSIKAKKWQVEDLRKLNDKILFQKLSKLGVDLNKKVFLKYTKEVDAPEELIEILAYEKDQEIKDQIYLIIFEIYRRFVTERRCLSIFCDELDYRIFQYDIHELKNDELLQDALANLKHLLDTNVDMGLTYEDAFQNLLKYVAHDLENFLFDYITEQIEANNKRYSLELIEGFYNYVNKKNWFDFLKAKLKSTSDVYTTNTILKNLRAKLEINPNLDLQFKMLEFMVDIGDRKLFIELAKQTSMHLKTEEEFKEILKIVSDYYFRLDKEIMEKKISNIIAKRSKIKSTKIIKKQDIKDFLNILS